MAERHAIVEWIAAAVVTAFEMGHQDESAIRSQLAGLLEQYGMVGDATVLDEVATAIG